jgi:hypothetical protein
MHRSKIPPFDQLVGECEQHRRDFEAKCLGSSNRQGAIACAVVVRKPGSQIKLSGDDIHRDVVRLMMRVSPLQAQTW